MTIALQSTFVAVALVAFALLTLPVFAHAASYGFVDNTGHVGMITADNSSIALANAYNMDSRSGVCILTSISDFNMIGDFVSGT